MGNKEKMNSYERVMRVFNGEKPDVCPAHPWVRDWCSRQVGMEFDKVDSELLRECKKILPKLPVQDMDILIVQEMGKNISGTGMDTNIVGGIIDYDPNEYTPPNIKRIVLHDLTPETGGNALGVGSADLITKKVYDKIDLKSTYTNTATATFLERAKIPMIMDTEKDAFDLSVKTIWNLPDTIPRILIIRNTLKLDELYVSEPVWEDIKDRTDIQAIGDWEPMVFDDSGELTIAV